MSRHSTGGRPLRAGGLLLAYLAVALAWPPHAQAAGADTVPHVEASDTAECPPPHDDDQCRLCRTVSGAAAAHVAAVPRLHPPVRTVRICTPGTIDPHGCDVDSHPPRAPPVLPS